MTKTNNSIIYQVDAFTDQLFKGNPAGVMIVDDTVTESWMQSMADEMNLSETAYVIPHTNHFEIRFFTPAVEVPLCGHATLASAHILYALGIKQTNEEIIFQAKGGKLVVKKEDDWIVMNFPNYPIQKTPTPVGFKDVVGFQPTETYSSSYNWIVAVAESEEEIKQAKPDFEQLSKRGLGHLMITSVSKQADFVVRCFAPDAGINEDPVTGSAQCALVPVWHAKTGKDNFDALQLSQRTGILKVKHLGDRVEIKGKCFTVFKAQLER